MSDNRIVEVIKSVIDMLQKPVNPCSCEAPLEYVAERNILKLHGFPVGELWPESVRDAMRLEGGPKVIQTGGQQCQVKQGQRQDMQVGEQLRETAMGHFQAVLAGDDEDLALAGNGLAPPNNAGLYQGRIAEIDPMRWNTRDSQYPHGGGQNRSDHNMSNITFPSLNDNELDDELEDNGEVEEEEEIGDADGENISLGDPAAGSKVYIAMSDDTVPPERIKFQLTSDSELVVEASVVTTSSWWKGLSPARKRSYLERHPNSKYAKAYRRKLAAKKAAAQKNAASSKKGSKASKKLDQSAEDSEAAIKKSGIDAADTIPEELDNEQDSQVDHLLGEMDDADLNDLDDNDQEAEQEDAEDDAQESDDGSDVSEVHVDPEAAKALADHSKQPGFFKPIVSAVKKRASQSSLGAMGRMMKGTMQEGDREKAIKGLSFALAAIAVVGVGAGIAAIAGPGLMMKYVSGFVDAFSNSKGSAGEGGGFNFSSNSASKDDEDDDQAEKPNQDEADEISDDNLADLSKKFIEWLEYKSKASEHADAATE